MVAVSSNGGYSFSKPNRDSVRLLTGLGVEGDVHAADDCQASLADGEGSHQPNLRQVHLAHEELFAEVG